VAAALVVPLYLVAVRTATGQRLEHRRVLRAAEDFLDVISVGSLAVLGTTLVLVALLRGRILRAGATAVTILGANVTTQVLKRTLDRPDLSGTGAPEPAGFPSGHTTVAMTLALGLVLVAPAGLRSAAVLCGAAYAAGVGLAVVGLGWHRPSDVAAAYLVATAWAAASAAVLALLETRAGGAERPALLTPRAGGLLAIAGAGAFALAVAVAAERSPDLVAVAALHASLVVLTIVAVLLGLALVWLFAALLADARGVAVQ
jgi:membrane-associated phospholipid phosphatase